MRKETVHELLKGNEVPRFGVAYLLFFRAAAVALRVAASFALAFAMPAINFSGTGSERGNLIVPLSLTLYDADDGLSDATSRALTG